MQGEPIGLYDVNTGKSLDVERWVDLGQDESGQPMGLAYTTASHGRLVQIRSGSLRCTYDVDGAMVDEDANRIGAWLNMSGADAVDAIRNNAATAA